MNAVPVTMQQVADAAGVDRSTVSLVLAGKGRMSAATRTRILTLVADLGYEPDAKAQRLVSNSTNNLVCLCSGTPGPGMATERMMLIQQALNEEGLEVPLYCASKPREKSLDSQVALIKQLRRLRPRAIVCSAFMLKAVAFEELELYQRQGGIVVTYDIPVPLECDQVVFDREHNAYQAARYLLDRGHRDIGICMSHIMKATTGTDMPQNIRLAGFRRAFTEFGVPLREEWLFEWLHQSQSFEQGGIALAKHFLSLKGRPSGLCIVNDYVALAFMKEIMNAGIQVPRDLSIIGHDNQPTAAYSAVPLTSMSQPSEEIAQAVIKLVMQRLRGSLEPPQTVTLRGNLVERQSVSVPPGQ